MSTPLTKKNPLKRTREETTANTTLVKDFIIQPKKLNTGSVMSSGRRKLDFIDLGDQEEASSGRMTDPNSFSFLKPMEIIQSMEPNIAEDVNILSKYKEIKQKNGTIKAYMYSQFWK